MGQSLKLSKKSNSSHFSNKKANGFFDKLMRVIYVFFIMAMDFVVFVYSINAKLVEDGQFNPALMYIFAGLFALSFVLIFALFFSKEAQNAVCALITMLVVVLFFYQFALFDESNFIEKWLEKKASWLTFIGIIPSSWLVGLLLGGIIFLCFQYTPTLYFVTIVVVLSSLLDIKNNEAITYSKDEYITVVDKVSKSDTDLKRNIIYFMIPEFPSYHFLSNMNNSDFRDLRNLMIGFYASNNFEVYPNAFVEKDDAVSNMIDIFNQVNYGSTASVNRGYAEIINSWNFMHGSLDYYGLEDNELYDALKQEGKYSITTYSAPGFNLCLKSDKMNTDRCVIKNFKSVKLYDKKASVEKNVYALLGEWVLSLDIRDLKSVAKMLLNQSNLKGYKVISENRRVSAEGATDIFEQVYKNYVNDGTKNFYMVYVDLPSDMFIYDEYCNLRPRLDWVAMKDNSVLSAGIEAKRKSYVQQAKCVIGKLQTFINDISKTDKFKYTDVIIQGVSNIAELSDMQAGRYSNFVKDRLVNLAIRKADNPKFLINANICLASDFTKTMLRNQEYCYTIDDMKMPSEEIVSLKYNLINNLVIRGSKISNIAINYLDWYSQFMNNSQDFQNNNKTFSNEELKKDFVVERMDIAPIDSSVVSDSVNIINDNNIQVSGDSDTIENNIVVEADVSADNINVSKDTNLEESNLAVDKVEQGAVVPLVEENASQVIDEVLAKKEEPKKEDSHSQLKDVESNLSEEVNLQSDEALAVENSLQNDVAVSVENPTSYNDDEIPAELSEDSQIEF